MECCFWGGKKAKLWQKIAIQNAILDGGCGGFGTERRMPDALGQRIMLKVFLVFLRECRSTVQQYIVYHFLIRYPTKRLPTYQVYL